MIWFIIKLVLELVEIRLLLWSDNFEVSERVYGIFFFKIVVFYYNVNKWKLGSGVLMNWNYVLEGCGIYDSLKYFYGWMSVGVEFFCINLKFILNFWL